jgi:hypothetical protein
VTFLAAGLASSSSTSSTISNVEPGLLGFLVVAGLGLALVFLLRSMNKQFKKIGPKPEEAQPDEAGLEEAEPGDAESDGTADEAERPQDAERF